MELTYDRQNPNVGRRHWPSLRTDALSGHPPTLAKGQATSAASRDPCQDFPAVGLPFVITVVAG